MTFISQYGFLSDCHGSALVSDDWSIDWWCPSRFDGPSIFSRMLDAEAGHWSIRPHGVDSTVRRYLPETMVIESEALARSGRARLTDGLLLGAGERGHDIGLRSPHAIVRLLEVVEGEVEFDVDLAPRPEYGLVTPCISRTKSGIEISGGSDRLTLTSSHPLQISGNRVTGTLRLSAGETTAFVLQHRSALDPPTQPLAGRPALSDTIAGWESWGRLHQAYQGVYRDEVRRSALVLQALTYRPTGSVVAAATTSLPEEIGGSANWDYRFGWLRDGSFTLKALWVGACPDEAESFFRWMAASAGSTRHGHFPVMFGVAGEHDLTEHELGHLAGYADSRPVRVGNDAWVQKQLDVLGEVLECASVLRDNLQGMTPEIKEMLQSAADGAASSWSEVDSGIWEGREGQRDYLSSKLMCWVALDRAVQLADLLGTDADAQRWTVERDRVKDAILERGWSDARNSFTGSFGSEHLDAAALLVPLVGFLPGGDERVRATVAAIEQELSDGPLVQRWTNAGDEGAFLICSYWLASAHAVTGNVERARRIFADTTAHANDLGLLSEEVHRGDGSLIGNFPQALSHTGLINAAWAIDEAMRGTGQPARHEGARMAPRQRGEERRWENSRKERR